MASSKLQPHSRIGVTVKGARAYHHGDLRSALVAAAREALESTSPEDITLKSLAVRLGVSQPAPYRHFTSREALLVAAATEGFEQFRDELAAAADDVSDSTGLKRSCLAYLAFGRENFGLYRLMFASHLLSNTEDETLKKAARGSFDLVLRQMSELVPAGDLQATAVWVWSTLHGLVMLEAENLTGDPSRGQVPSIRVVQQMVDLFNQT